MIPDSVKQATFEAMFQHSSEAYPLRLILDPEDPDLQVPAEWMPSKSAFLVLQAWLSRNLVICDGTILRLELYHQNRRVICVVPWSALRVLGLGREEQIMFSEPEHPVTVAATPKVEPEQLDLPHSNVVPLFGKKKK